jgi:hypothetical protein
MEGYQLACLRPYEPNKVQFRKGPGGKWLAYITARDVMDRLDEVFKAEGWQNRYDYIGGRMICYLSCKVKGDWITKADGADDTQIESAKGGISDSLKRSAVLWGIGRLYYSPGSFDENRVPAHWATPEGFDKIWAERMGKEIAQFQAELGLVT